MLQNAYFLAKIGADTAEHEQHFAEILPKTGNYPTGPLMSVSQARARHSMGAGASMLHVDGGHGICAGSHLWLITQDD